MSPLMGRRMACGAREKEEYMNLKKLMEPSCVKGKWPSSAQPVCLASLKETKLYFFKNILQFTTLPQSLAFLYLLRTQNSNNANKRRYSELSFYFFIKL